MTTLLELKDLHTFFKTKKGIVKAVNGVSYSVDEGRTLGVVGESGSGKSVSAMSILQLLDGNGYIDSGEIYFDGKELTKLPLKEIQKIRGEIHDDDPGRHNHHDRLNHRKVPASDRGQEESSDSRNRKYLFDDNGSRHNLRRRNSQKSDNRNHGVAKYMAP